MIDEFDETIADTLLSDEERAEIHHIQHHFDEIEDEKERAVMGWRATSVYVAAFKREIVRLQHLTAALDSNHAMTNCRCGHGEENHYHVAICRMCAEGHQKELTLTGDSI